MAIDTNLLVALRAIDLLLTPTPSRDHMLLYCPVSILERLSAMIYVAHAALDRLGHFKQMTKELAFYQDIKVKAF